MAEAAPEPTDQRHREIDQPVGDPRGDHQVAEQDEERHGEDQEGIEAVEHPLDEDFGACAAELGDRGKTGNAEARREWAC